jgi:hypothetical protein
LQRTVRTSTPFVHLLSLHFCSSLSCSLGPASAAGFSAYLAHPSCKASSIDLSGNALSETDALSLLKALQSNPNNCIFRLDVRGNSEIEERERAIEREKEREKEAYEKANGIASSGPPQQVPGLVLSSRNAVVQAINDRCRENETKHKLAAELGIRSTKDEE